jgi:hypothetical protein
MNAKRNKRKAESVRRKKLKVVHSAEEIDRILDEDFRKWFRAPKGKIEHDLNIEHLTDERFRDAKRLIRACAKVGVWRLKQGELSGDARFYVVELASELAQTIQALIEEDDVMLARRLPPIVEILQNALKVYGSKLTGSIKKRLPIKQLLKKHKACDLLAMLSALHPDWETILHISNRREIESLPEETLHKLLLSTECWVGEHDGKRTKETRSHRIAEIIENVMAMREAENKNINLFVEHLSHGQLWSGPGRTFEKCDWHGKKDLPARDYSRAWMKLVMPYLKRVTGGNAMKLHVFRHLIAARRFVYHDASGKGCGRLAADSPKHIWNQVETEIRKAWVTMAKQARKPNSKKAA